jgi:nucleoside-diphosphate-sugar epimerase
MKALVTGASGFIGRRLASTLARRGHDVVCLVRRTSDTRPLESLPVRLTVGDLGDPSSLASAVAGRNRVFHLAGIVQAVGEAAFETVNVGGTRNLVEACLSAAPDLERFIYVSSIAAAGPNAPGKARCEDDAPCPVSAYGRSKLAAERIVLEAGARLPVTILRPPNVLGPGSHELAGAIRLLRRGIMPEVGDELPRTSLIDVDDLVEAMLLAAEHPGSVGQTYFVTDGRTYAWPEITAALATELGIRGFMIRVPFGAQVLAARLAEAASRLSGWSPILTREIVRAGHDHFWIYDGSKITRELGFRPKYSLCDSLRRTVASVREKSGAGRSGKGAKGQ